MASLKTVVTHDGIFHADEVFAIAILQWGYEHAFNVIRTRDPITVNSVDIAIDVGGTYDPDKNRYDHHQKEGAGERENGVPYSSCGLIWKEYGIMALRCLGVNHERIRKVWDLVDEGIIQAIDVVDCSGMKIYKDSPSPIYTISQVISSFNTPFVVQDDAFKKAMDFAKQILLNEIRSAEERASSAYYLGEQITKQLGKQILVLDNFVAGSDNLIEWNGFTRVVFPDISGSWRVKALPRSEQLPEAWGGLNGEDLDKVTGVSGCIFCHRGLFIAGHNTKEGAIALANRSI